MARELRKQKETQEFNPSQEQMAKDMLKQYEGKSEDDLMQELFSAAQRGKQDGTFNEEAIKNFVETAGPMLNEEQRQRMNQILSMIR